MIFRMMTRSHSFKGQKPLVETFVLRNITMLLGIGVVGKPQFGLPTLIILRTYQQADYGQKY